MPPNKSVSWVHGSGMQVQFPERINRERRLGPLGWILGTPAQETWVHFPVPTPVLASGKRIRIGAALVSFRTRSHATVYEVHVHDGEKIIAEYKGLDLQGDHLNSRFEISGHPEVDQGINISLRVWFADNAPEEQDMRIEIVGAGVEFLGFPTKD